MIRKFLFAATMTAAMTAAGLSGAANAGETPSADGAKVYFVNLKDGATLSSPFKVIFGLSGMGVAPAGTKKANTGHHHVLIDRPALGKGKDGADEFAANLPSDANHKHFGKGQTETMLKLEPGKHTLQMVLGDMSHIPHKTPVTSQVITITVK